MNTPFLYGHPRFLYFFHHLPHFPASYFIQDISDNIAPLKYSSKAISSFYQKTRLHTFFVNNTFIRNTWLRYLINEKQYLPNPPVPSRHLHFTKNSSYLIYGIWDISAFPHFVKIGCKSGENIFCDLG